MPEGKWFGMNIQQRQKHISVVNKTEVADHTHDASISSVRSVCDLPLSVSFEDAAKRANIPLKCLEGIWGKATRLLNSDDAVAPAPGQKPETRMVLSYSGKTSHLVGFNKTGDFICDSNRPNWKGLGICSHTVVVAEVNGQLQEILSIKKRRKPASLTSIVSTSAPRGHGKKGGSVSRSRKPSEPIVTRVQMNINGGSISQSQSFDQSTSYHTAPSHPTPGNVVQFQYMEISHYLALHFLIRTLLHTFMGNLHIYIHHCFPLNLCHCLYRHLHLQHHLYCVLWMQKQVHEEFKTT